MRIPDQLQTGPLKPNFDALCSQHRDRVYWLAYRMLYDRSDAEDVTQEAFVRAWVNYDRFDPTGSFGAWINRIASNLCIEQLRRRRRRSEISLDSLPDKDCSSFLNIRGTVVSIGSIDRCILGILEEEEVQKAVYTLSPGYRNIVFLLRQDYSYEEISQILDCPVGTVRSRIHRMRAKMREIMAQQQAGATRPSQSATVSA